MFMREYMPRPYMQPCVPTDKTQVSWSRGFQEGFINNLLRNPLKTIKEGEEGTKENQEEYLGIIR